MWTKSLLLSSAFMYLTSFISSELFAGYLGKRVFEIVSTNLARA